MFKMVIVNNRWVIIGNQVGNLHPACKLYHHSFIWYNYHIIHGSGVLGHLLHNYTVCHYTWPLFDLKSQSTGCTKGPHVLNMKVGILKQKRIFNLLYGRTYGIFEKAHSAITSTQTTVKLLLRAIFHGIKEAAVKLLQSSKAESA